MAQINNKEDNWSVHTVLGHLIFQFFDQNKITDLYRYTGYNTDIAGWEYGSLLDCMRDTFINEAQ